MGTECKSVAKWADPCTISHFLTILAGAWAENLRQQRGRGVQQADQEDVQEVDPIRHRGRLGEETRHDVPPLQRRDGPKESEGWAEIVEFMEKGA